MHIDTEEMAMPPSISETTKKDVTRLRIEATLTIGLSLPKVCKPSITSVEIKPTLHNHKITPIQDNPENHPQESTTYDFSNRQVKLIKF